ncbi:MAG: WD40/YVTN/BNR-like repeat-containing protein, partial [Candidatus Angelobacter sp.]
MSNKFPLVRFIPLCTLLVLLSGFAFSQQLDPNLYSGLRWRMIGPHRGGRTIAVSGVEGQPNVYYFGGVGGGVWKTANGGITWEPIFDGQPISSIGALAVASSNPSVIYVGTGEADFRSNLTYGNGVYKSTDGGGTWKNIGLTASRHISRIAIDPHNPDIVFVAAMGSAYGPSSERGVFRSTDGGSTWQKVLFKDENTGAIDITLDPDNPKTLWAALVHDQRPPWSAYPPVTTNGAIFKSTDGGTEWNPVTGGGLPEGDWGRVGLAVARGTHGQRVYALIDTKEGGLFKSDDGGQTWLRTGTDPRIRGRLWYFGEVYVDPKNPDTVYLPNVSIYRSTDAGKTFVAIKGAPGGDDYHALWIDPSNPQRMIFGSDQGAGVSVDAGHTWSSWFNQPTAQFYHVAVDNDFPYHVYGAQQDSGSVFI